MRILRAISTHNGEPNRRVLAAYIVIVFTSGIVAGVALKLGHSLLGFGALLIPLLAIGLRHPRIRFASWAETSRTERQYALIALALWGGSIIARLIIAKLA